MTNTLRVASINIGGIQTVDRFRLLLRVCLDGHFDIIGLQEVTFFECSVLESHFHLISNVGPRKLGTAVLIRRGVSFSRELLEPDGRLISVDVGPFTFINIYAHSGTTRRAERSTLFLKTIPAYAATSRLPIVMVGDFNCIDDANDRSQTQNPTSTTIHLDSALSELVSGLDLVDVWKRLRPSDKGHTHHYHNGSSRIDRIYTSSSFSENFSSIVVRLVSISDHFPLEATLSCDLEPQNRFNVGGFWKFNTSVLSEEAFQGKIYSFMENSVDHPLRESNVTDWWAHTAQSLLWKS